MAPSSQDPWLSHQPFKAVWTLLAVTLTASKIPFWLLYFLPTRLRQHPQWTYRQAIVNELLKSFVYHASIVRVKTPITLDPGAEKERFVTFAPLEADLYRGILQSPDVKPATVGGTWYPTSYVTKIDHGQRVVLHCHGGAYVTGTGRPVDLGQAASLLTKHLSAKVFGIQYRLSSNPGGQFPAAFQDAVTAYKGLLDQGIPASSLILSGDSAGGNLALALLRYISEHEDLLPAPAATLLWSPWLDLTAGMEVAGTDKHKNYGTDYLTGAFTVWGSHAYAPATVDASNRYISPLKHPFATKSPVWVQVCGAEILRDDGVKFAEGLKSVPGNKVAFHEEPYANHDILLLGSTTGFEEAAHNAGRAAGKFLASFP